MREKYLIIVKDNPCFSACFVSIIHIMFFIPIIEVEIMKNILMGVILGLMCLSTYAADNCYGSSTYYTCNDYKTGNSYQVSKYGNSTQVNGYNSRTGSTWNQNTQNYGNQSYTTGHDRNGNTWQHNTNQIGNTQYYNGNNSQGETYSGSCNQYGCTTNRYGR